MNVADKQDRVRMEAAMLHIHEACFETCVTSFAKKELSVEEVQCIERCGWKFSAAHNHFALVSAKAQRGGPKGGAVGGPVAPAPLTKI